MLFAGSTAEGCATLKESNANWVARTTQTNKPAGFDAQSTQLPGAAEMPAEISEAFEFTLR